jgi:crossover junction endodeoxyribonuclease RusA
MKYDFECQVEVPGMKPYRIELPWPPSVNSYWRNIGSRAIISKPGRQYRQAVQVAVLIAGGRRNMLGSLSVRILAYPPDKRRRDLDNVLKAPLDALAKCGVYEDDSQISKLSIERMGPTKPGCLLVEIVEI